MLPKFKAGLPYVGDDNLLVAPALRSVVGHLSGQRMFNLLVLPVATRL
jgi:hypothetical protein